ncbi:hypothetical protein GCL60_11815 [Silvanigrella paludirubra]|uniref:Uncharacterized protein n=1 Tax=Silvanigrella paludirubra TaxID=2499159 RepID=A0A6N6VQL5_9BACT|nr:hypothetical protein [Silvanigrella paludirubra]KAB8037854.1 hypothetical protein GCL60_11815 [Silvanigrella paludirubra]
MISKRFKILIFIFLSVFILTFQKKSIYANTCEKSCNDKAWQCDNIKNNIKINRELFDFIFINNLDALKASDISDNIKEFNVKIFSNKKLIFEAKDKKLNGRISIVLSKETCDKSHNTCIKKCQKN